MSDIVKNNKFHIFLITELLVFTIIFKGLIIPGAFVPSGSMAPTIESGSMVFVVRDFLLRDYERRDVVVFPAPDNPQVLYCKRIIGVPGDIVLIREGRTYINGLVLDEPYVCYPDDTVFGPVKVPEDSFFCMGDNRKDSYDGRFWDHTFVKKKNITGQAVFTWWSHGPRFKIIK